MINYFINTTLLNKNKKNKIVPVSQTNNLMGKDKVISDLKSFEGSANVTHSKADFGYEKSQNSYLNSTDYTSDISKKNSDTAMLNGSSEINRSGQFISGNSNILSVENFANNENLYKNFEQNTNVKNDDNSIDYDLIYRYILDEIKKEMGN